MSGFQELRDMGVVFRPFDTWPPRGAGGWTRFGASWEATVGLLARELRFLDGRRVVVELDLTEADLRIDGLPRANARFASPAARVSFQSKWGPLRYETCEFSDWRANVRAIALSMEALRKVDRYGVSKRGEQYRGWRQIEASTSVETLIATRDDAERFLRRWSGDWRLAIKETHPDVGGDPDEFRKVMRAKDLLA